MHANTYGSAMATPSAATVDRRRALRTVHTGARQSRPQALRQTVHAKSKILATDAALSDDSEDQNRDRTRKPDQPSTSEPQIFWGGVDIRLRAGLADELHVHEPTPVQRAAIPEILSGKNVAIQCYTGSGKTLSYVLPALTMAIRRSEEEWSKVTRKTRGDAGKVHCVIVAPSRELAMQIVRVAQAVLPPQAKQACQQVIGGANVHRQREALKINRPVMVVGTPGRLAELSKDGTLQTHNCGLLIMDEIDQLLAPQFREDMVRITEHTGKRCAGGRQTVVVSATMTSRVLAMCNPWCPDPEKIFVNADGELIKVRMVGFCG